MPSLPSPKVFRKYKKAGNALAFPAQKFNPRRPQAAKSVADFRVRRREIILIINRRDMRVAIYSSRFARVAAAYGGKARSEVRSPKIKGIPSDGWDPFDFNLDS